MGARVALTSPRVSISVLERDKEKGWTRLKEKKRV